MRKIKFGDLVMAINYRKLSTDDDNDQVSILYDNDETIPIEKSSCRNHSCNGKRRIVLAVVSFVAVIIMITSLAIKIECRPDVHTQVIFKSGMKGYPIFRIPAIVYHQQYFLAFAEARHGISDSSNSDIIMRRGLLQKSKVKWEDPKIVGTLRGKRLNGPVAVVDKEINTIFLMYTVLPKNVKERKLISHGHFDQSLIVVNSTDLGVTWSLPRDITNDTLGKMNPVPSIFATGPGHGIQLTSGRLVIPGNFYAKDKNSKHKTFEYGSNCHSTVLISDDHGVTWRPGGYVPYQETKDGTPIETNEPSVAEISPNKLIINSRTIEKNQHRAQSTSVDGGETFGPPELVPTLIEPNNIGQYAGVAGSVLSIHNFWQDKSTTNQTWALFSNTANSRWRFGMSIRLSKDGCQSWSKPWTIWRWASAYSDLTQIDMDTEYSGNPTFAVLYEQGCLLSAINSVSLRIFSLEDVMKGIR